MNAKIHADISHTSPCGREMEYCRYLESNSQG